MAADEFDYFEKMALEMGLEDSAFATFVYEQRKAYEAEQKEKADGEREESCLQKN